MIANLNDTIDGDLEMLDGYDEIDEESQEKVRKALKEGHEAKARAAEEVSQVHNSTYPSILDRIIAKFMKMILTVTGR